MSGEKTELAREFQRLREIKKEQREIRERIVLAILTEHGISVEKVDGEQGRYLAGGWLYICARTWKSLPANVCGRPALGLHTILNHFGIKRENTDASNDNAAAA